MKCFLITLYCSLKCRLHDIWFRFLCNIGEHHVVEIYLPHVWSIKIIQHSAESIVTTFYVLACIMLYGFWLCEFRCTRLVDISSLVPLCVVQVTIITFYHNNFHHLHTHTALSSVGWNIKQLENAIHYLSHVHYFSLSLTRQDKQNICKRFMNLGKLLFFAHFYFIFKHEDLFLISRA